MSEFIIYKASAGSGKTFQLTRHYLELLLREPDNYKKILAVTFTNKAAGELKERVVGDLVKINGHDPHSSDHFGFLSKKLNKKEADLQKNTRDILRSILQDYGRFSIGTIDNFFQKVLRSFSKEVGINNGYKLELNASSFLAGSVDMLMSDIDQDKALLSWLGKWVDYRIQNDESWARIEKDLISIGFEFLKEQLMEEMNEDWIDHYSEKAISSFASLVRKIEFSFEKELENIASEAKALLDKYGLDPSDFKGGSRSVPAYLMAVSHDPRFLKRVRPVKAIDNPEEWYKKTLTEEMRKRIVEAWDGGFNNLLKKFLEYLNENEPLYYSANLIRQNIYSLGLSGKLMNYINKHSDQTNSLLINLTSPILNKIIDENPTPFIYEKVGSYYDHFMIDEFQDTSKLQWANFLPLIRNSLSQDDFSMVVGDVKQSIFRWRNSDWKLMAETAKRDLKAFGINEMNLENNWRSRDSVIDFNNLFFSSAPQKIIEKIKLDLASVSGQSDLDAQAIQDIYSNVSQSKGSGKPGGFVEVAFQGEGDEDSWDLKLPRLVEELQVNHHYKPEDITLLVRKNDQAKAIVKILQEYKEEHGVVHGCSYNIVSSESYELSNSPSVRCIIWAIRYIMDPEESYYKARLAQEYISLKRKQLSDGDYKNIIKIRESPNLFEELVPVELIEKRELFSYSSGPTLIEEIIRIMQLQTEVDELPYLMAFRDQVIAGIGVGTSLDDISVWWDDQGYKFNVPMTDQAGAMRVMTIHKAKGLEFKVVVMPWCDWEMGTVKAGQLMWVETKGTEFSQIPMIPMSFGSQLGKSSFSSVFSKEKLQIYMDNLNLVYVAFTRAIDRLYAFCPAKVKKGSYRVSNLLKDVLDSEIHSGVYSFGNPDTMPTSKKEAGDVKRIDFESFPPKSFSGVSGLRKTFDSRAIHHGKVMHEILEKTVVLSDLKEAVFSMRDRGELGDVEAENVYKHLTSLLQRKDIADWFSGENQVYVEKSILVPGKGEFRPDRIIEKGGELIILDYKFGDPRSSHERQLKTYRLAIEKMDYSKVSAYLLYPESGLLLEVE